jgi:hypothetical protein
MEVKILIGNNNNGKILSSNKFFTSLLHQLCSLHLRHRSLRIILISLQLATLNLMFLNLDPLPRPWWCSSRTLTPRPNNLNNSFLSISNNSNNNNHSSLGIIITFIIHHHNIYRLRSVSDSMGRAKVNITSTVHRNLSSNHHHLRHRMYTIPDRAQCRDMDEVEGHLEGVICR